MANKFNAATNSKLSALVTTITTAIGNSLEMDFTDSAGFTIKLEVDPTGQNLAVTAHPTGIGESNPFGAEVNGRNPRTPAFKVRGDQLP